VLLLELEVELEDAVDLLLVAFVLLGLVEFAQTDRHVPEESQLCGHRLRALVVVFEETLGFGECGDHAFDLPLRVLHVNLLELLFLDRALGEFLLHFYLPEISLGLEEGADLLDAVGDGLEALEDLLLLLVVDDVQLDLSHLFLVVLDLVEDLLGLVLADLAVEVLVLDYVLDVECLLV